MHDDSKPHEENHENNATLQMFDEKSPTAIRENTQELQPVHPHFADTD